MIFKMIYNHPLVIFNSTLNILKNENLISVTIRGILLPVTFRVMTFERVKFCYSNYYWLILLYL